VQTGYWGQYLFQSDPDYDIINNLKERAGLDLCFFEAEEDTVKARNVFNEGKFNEFFDIIRAEKTKTLVLLTATAMHLGANIKTS
jgi:hypothetical protein